MNIQHEIKDGNLAIITLKLDKAEVESRYQKEIKEVAKKSAMPGFRPGHAPKGIIEQKYGASVRFDALNHMVNDSLNEYLNEHKFMYYGMPMSVTDEEKKPMGDTLDFTFELGLRPEVALKIDDSLVFDKYKVSVSEDEINKELDLIQRRNGALGDVEIVENTDMINGDFVECNEDGTPFEGGVTAMDKSILIASIKDEEEKAKFMGKKIGDVVSFDIFKTIGNDANEIAQIFGIVKEAANDLNKTFTITIKKIQRLIPAELNDELLAKYNNEIREVKSVDDLRAVIKKEIEDYYASQAEGMMEDEIIKGMVKSHNIKMPDAFLLRWIKQQNKDKSEHDIEHDYLHEKEYLKWSIIRDNIFEQETYSITDEELELQYQVLLENHMRRFGYDPYNTAFRNEFETKYFKREDQEESVVNILRTAKALGYIKGHIKINEMPIDSKEFDKVKLERSKHEHDHGHDHA
jgi:trigger factor